MQISHVSCIWPSGCPCLFILNTRHNRRYFFCRGFLVYCKPRFIPTYIFVFWNRNWVFKLTTIDVSSGLQTRNFQSSVIHRHEFSLIGKFNVHICETHFEKPSGTRELHFGLTEFWRVTVQPWWPQLVGMAYNHDTGHIPKISNQSVIMKWQLMSFYLEALFAIIINKNHICFCILIHAINLMKSKLSAPMKNDLILVGLTQCAGHFPYLGSLSFKVARKTTQISYDSTR